MGSLEAKTRLLEIFFSLKHTENPYWSLYFTTRHPINVPSRWGDNKMIQAYILPLVPTFFLSRPDRSAF